MKAKCKHIPISAYTSEGSQPRRKGIVRLNTYPGILFLFFEQVYRKLGQLGTRVHNTERQLDGIHQSIKEQQCKENELVVTVAACQKDTADALNRKLERHLLHPAIETIAVLVEEINRLRDCGKQLENKFPSFVEEAEISSSLAEERLAHLDIQRLMPTVGDSLDTKKHAVCSYSETDVPHSHGQISSVISPGVLYRGQVLRSARVTVFRCNKNKPTKRERK